MNVYYFDTSRASAKGQKVSHYSDASKSLQAYTTGMAGDRKFFLKQWREFRGLTQQELADRTGRTKGYISNIERGESRYNEDVLEELAAALKCESWQLLGENPLEQNGTAQIVDIWDHIPQGNREQARQILETFTEKKA
jgi:transcriptional regulator with XRE-family HTH domain